MCEERELYKTTAHVKDEQILWIEGNPEVIEAMRATLRTPCGCEDPRVRIIQGLVSDREEDVMFHVTNNGQSSSFLPLEKHKEYHPHVVETKTLQLCTTTLPALLAAHNINASVYDFLAMDIQGAEYHALRGMEDMLHQFQHIYLEINEEELYKGCGLFDDVRVFLESHGFSLKEKVVTEAKWGDAYFTKCA